MVGSLIPTMTFSSGFLLRCELGYGGQITLPLLQRSQPDLILTHFIMETLGLAAKDEGSCQIHSIFTHVGFPLGTK